MSKVGYALVTFLEEQDPYLIERIFSAIRREKDVVLDNLLKKVNEHDRFLSWLSSKASEYNRNHTNNENGQSSDPLPPKTFEPDNHTNDSKMI